MRADFVADAVAPPLERAPPGWARPIRTRIRGLAALTSHDLRNDASLSAVAAGIRLPRTTIQRIPETPCRPRVYEPAVAPRPPLAPPA